jgi:hypothetical protein
VEFIAAHVAGLRACSDRARRRFASLPLSQLNWKPSPEAWSIAQCLDHLIVSNRQYFPLFDQVAHGQYRASGYLRAPLLPALFGRMLIYALGNPKMKSRTVGSFEPAASSYGSSIVEDFVRHNDDLIHRIESVATRDLGRIIVRSAFARFVIYSARDMITVLLVHEQRHLAQAERVMTLPGFAAESTTSSTS